MARGFDRDGSSGNGVSLVVTATSRIRGCRTCVRTRIYPPVPTEILCAQGLSTLSTTSRKALTREALRRAACQPVRQTALHGVTLPPVSATVVAASVTVVRGPTLV